MTNLNVTKYAKDLYSRTGSAALLNRAIVHIGDWKPKANMCHHNVTFWCENRHGYEPVRGWLYFDLPGFPFVKFVAHSAVRTPEGELFDITPSSATQDYPFIESRLSESEYAELVENMGHGELLHYFEGV